jgi:hypothetical protein
MHRLAVPRLVLPCLLGFLGFAPWFSHAAEARKPNILLITVDDRLPRRSCTTTAPAPPG